VARQEYAGEYQSQPAPYTLLMNTTPPVDQPALDVLLALDAQLQEAVSSSRIISAEKVIMQVMSE
jgi:hypothetical protein